MTNEVVIHHGTTMVRRLRLAPSEAMPWHRDPFRWVAVVLSGDALSRRDLNAMALASIAIFD
jgi:quercetin dioxygenase-like cupin family protein